MVSQNQQQREFNALIRPHLQSLRMTALRMAKNETDAEDIVQETLYKAYRGMHLFERNTNFKAWVFRILVNTYITVYRKNVKLPYKVSIDESYEEHYDHSLELYDENDQADKFIDSDFSDEVLTALEKLPYHFKSVILLCDIQEFSYHEISNMIGIPVGTVMSRLHRGRKLLQRMLWGYATEKGLAQGEKPYN
jgi:RNA polymerase sigma-70 factor (ECF subfamily)